MAQKRIRLGLIGNGLMVRTEYLPYLEGRISRKSDVEIRWVSGCLCTAVERADCPFGASTHLTRQSKCEAGHEQDWQHLLDDEPVDAVLVSLPNSLHEAPVREALRRGVCVAVDKPTTTRADVAAELVALGERKGAVFVTLSQRRYEDVYQAVAEIIERGGLGEVRLINYMIAHEYFGRGGNSWPSRKSLSGGGALISSGYHGIDTILWLLDRNPKARAEVKSVSAMCRQDDCPDAVETLAVVRMTLDNGGIFNAVASFENPLGSLDENIKMFGSCGAIRIMRDKPRKLRSDQSAATLTYQHARGAYTVYDTRDWGGKRWAPFEDFLNAVHLRAEGKTWKVLSPASDSVRTIRIIEKAYESAIQNGREIELMSTPKVRGVHHVAVQTSDIDRALNFYMNVLGTELVKRNKFKRRELAWLRAGDITIELFSKREGEQLNDWNDFYSGPVHIAFVVEDLDSFLETARSRGAQFHPSHPEPFVPPAEGAKKIAYLLGPDGEEVEIRCMSDCS